MKPLTKRQRQAASTAPAGTPSANLPAWLIAITGLACLSVAMGLGRFAFTPLLPMMLAEGSVDLPAASWLASANYLGYMLGAVACALQPWLWARWARLGTPPALRYASLIRVGLLATAVLTLAMSTPWSATWPLLRFAAGLASALVLVFTSGWCLSQLARLGQPALGGVIYAGPGVGIVISGLLASGMVWLGWSAASAWAVMGALAFGLTGLVWRVLRASSSGVERLHALGSATSADLPVAAPQSPAEMPLLALGYGIAGFGYIITATFLPVIARAALPGSPWLDLFWPTFGLGVASGALLASRLKTDGDRRWLLVACYLMQATGIAISLWLPSLFGFALGSLLLGLPFTALTFFSMQEVRRLKPATAASYIGVLTATFGLGQVLGPALVALLLQHTPSPAEGFKLALELAATSLLGGAALFAAMAKLYPVRAPGTAD